MTFPYNTSSPGIDTGAGSVNGLFINNFGADPSGVRDSSPAVRAAQSAMGTSAGPLIMGTGTYLFNSPFLTFGLNQYLWGQGQFATNCLWNVGGGVPLITVQEPGAFNGSHRAGREQGFSIVGPQGAGNVVGMKYGALQSLQIDDVGFFGLDGGAVLGVKTGASDYSEEAVVTRFTASECGATSGFVFGFNGTSFDYSKFDGVVVAEANVSIFNLANNAQMQGMDLSLRGNLHGGLTNTGAIVAIDRGNSAGTSYMTNAKFAVSMEQDTGAGAVGHFLLWMDSTNSVSQFIGDGVFNIKAAGVNPNGIHNPNFLPASFNGITLDPSGGGMTGGDAFAVMGGTCYTPANAQFGVPFAGNIFPQFGDIISLQLNNGVNTLVFNGTNGFVRSFTMYIKQPSSGAAGTVVWPGSVKWPAHTAPTLSATNGFVDKIEFEYIPNTGFHYGTLIGLNYG